MQKWMPKVALALDCSTEVLSLALYSPSGVMACNAVGGGQTSQSILREIDRLLSQAGVTWADIELLVCGRGPGAFTGVRVAVAVVQGLALARDLPIYAVSGLLALAEQARLECWPNASGLDLTALLDARMGQVYVAACTWDGCRWHSGAEALLNYADAARLPAQVLAGNVRQAWAGLDFASPAALHDAQPSAQALLAVALQDLAAGAEALKDPAALAPVYVRNQVAQTTAERAAAKAQGM